MAGIDDIPPVVRERFEVLDLRAGGAVTQAIKAIDKRNGSTVLLSLFNADMQDVAMARSNFLHRIQFATEIGPHPNLNLPTEWDLESGYIITPFIDGQPLRTILQDGPISIGAIVRVFRGVAQGIAHLHRVGFVHRDIVLHNIIVDAAWNAKIADFGAAGRLDDQKPGQLSGILNYLAPEILTGESAQGVKSDLYMIGICLYEVLAGRSPFGSSTHLGLIAAARRGVRPVREWNPSAPPDLARIAERLCAANPNERPDSADLLVDELRRCRGEKALLANVGETQAHVMREFPSHIGRVYGSALSLSNPSDRLRRVLDVFEVALKTLTFVLLAERRILPDQIAELARPSLGIWLSLYRSMRNAPLNSAESSAALTDTSRMAVVLDEYHLRLCDDMVALRNRLVHAAGAALPQDECIQLLDRADEIVLQLLTAMSAFRKRIIAIPRNMAFDGEAYELDAAVCVGDSTTFPSQKWRSPQPLITNHAYLFETDQPRPQRGFLSTFFARFGGKRSTSIRSALDLHPYLLLTRCPSCGNEEVVLLASKQRGQPAEYLDYVRGCAVFTATSQ